MTGGRMIGLAVVMLTASAAAQPAPASRTGLIVGQVVDAGSGRPVGGAIVTLSGPPPVQRAVFQRGLDMAPTPPPRILTGPDGWFVFRDLPRGRFNITVTKGGYGEGAYGRRGPSGPAQQLALDDGERVGDVVIRLWKYAAISGAVVDEAGEPLVAVQVRAFRRTVTTGRRRFVGAATASTDDRGVYRLGGLIPGEYVVMTAWRHVAVPLATAQESQAAGTAAGSTIFELGGTMSLPGSSMALQAGNVVYPLGRGVPIPPPASEGRLFVYPATFHQSADSLAQAIAVTLTAGDERGAIDLQLHPVATVRVSGTVVGPEPPGVPIPIRLRTGGADSLAIDQDWPATVTDREARFTFPAVPAGEYLLRVVTPIQPMHWAEVPLTIGRSDIDGLTVNLQAALRISGRVEFDGRLTRPAAAQLAQVPITVEQADITWDASSRTPPTRIDASGQFTTPGFPAGRYILRVSGSPVGWMFKSARHNGRDLSETPVDLQGGDVTGVVITFTDRWTGMRGVVRSPQGTGDAEATVVVFPTDAQAWTDLGLNPRRVRSTATRRGGEFSFTSLPPGDYYAAALPDHLALDWQDPKFMEGLARLGTRVTIGEGEQKTQDLRIVEVR